MRRFALLLTVSLILGIVPATTATAVVAAEPSGIEATPAPVLDARAATSSGTPLALLAKTPAVPPLRVGYKSGLFPTLSSTAKDARGCTLRNQMLIKLATVAPKVAAGCKLVGGVWYADFGTTKLTKASQVRLGKLVPDVYVYGQGASQWTPAQRAAYFKVIPRVSATSASKTRMKPMPVTTLNRPNIQAHSIVLMSLENMPFIERINTTLITNSDPNEALLANLKRQFPKMFESWTIATLLNAQAWGLSLSPNLFTNFGTTLTECSTGTNSTLRSKPMPIQTEGAANPCLINYAVTETGTAFQITAVPQQASTVPVTRDGILNGYGTPTGDTISRFLFGIHAPANWFSDEASGADGPIYPENIPDVPVGFLRLWDTETTWADIEPSKGSFVWRKLDKQIQMGQQLDARVMLVLGKTPAWAGSSGTAMPKSIDDWRNYVSTVCRRYGASISAYEVWNEANLATFWTGTPAEMADLTKVAFEEIRACNPSAQVVAANTTSRATGSFGTFFPQYLQELKARNWPADAYSVHSYPTASGGADARINGIGQFRAALALAGAPFTTVYDTEVNYGLAGLGEQKVDLTGWKAMILMSRTYIDSVRYGFGSTFWFVWTAQPDTKFGIQFTREATAERRAWNTTYDWLVGSRFQRCELTTAGVTVCQFSKGAENFTIAWRGDIESPNDSMPAGYLSGLGSRQCDLSGRCFEFGASDRVGIGPEPVRIDGKPTSKGPTSTGSTTNPVSQNPGVKPGAPIITDLSLTYGPSNKADATAAWAAPANAKSAAVNGYYYSWIKCGASSGCSRTCTTASGCSKQVASGRTGASTFTVTAPLSEGPGNYLFEVMALGPDSQSPASTQVIALRRSDAAPPSSVMVAVRGGKGEITWNEPDMRSSLIAGYQVQVRNMPSGDWVTVAQKAQDPRVAFTGSSELNLAAGNTIIARVRTVLKSGATSILVSTNPLVISEQLLAPREPQVARSPTGEALPFALRPVIADTSKFPTIAYQVRFSTDGTTWTMANFATDFIGSPRPSAKETLFPYGRLTIPTTAAYPQGQFPANTKFQFRAVDSEGSVPSDWVDAPENPI